MPRKLYRNADLWALPWRFVKTGAFRRPRKGEYFLSGAVPEVYRASCDAATPFYIMRPATADETQCPTCKTKLNPQGA